jgi:hypothetical protein
MDVTADLENAHFRSKYVSLGALLKAVRPVLAKHGLSVVTTVEPSYTYSHEGVKEDDVGDHYRTTKERDGHLIQARLYWGGMDPQVAGEYAAGHSAHFIESTVHCPKQASVHAFASFHTYARRWLIQGLCGVGVDLDDDGNAAVGKQEEPVKGNRELRQRVTKR